MSDVIEYKCPSCNASMGILFDSKSPAHEMSVLRYGNDGRRVSAHAEIRRYTDGRKINFKRQLVLNEHRSVAE